MFLEPLNRYWVFMIFISLGCVLFFRLVHFRFQQVPTQLLRQRKSQFGAAARRTSKTAIGLMYTIKARNNKVSELAITIMFLFFQRGKTE
jgi:hypothetical protein